jgi:hypothetical protein
MLINLLQQLLAYWVYKIIIYNRTAKPRTAAPTTAETTPMFRASTITPASSLLDSAVAAPSEVAVAEASPLEPVAAGVALSSPYSEVIEAITLLSVGSAKTAELT